MKCISSTLIATLLGVSMVNAHMIMSSPTPYSADSLNNSPLEADGSDFPCKLRPNAFQAPTAETIIGIGESHPLSFVGSATHGGGSCQISLTTDLQPSKSSAWKVIKSFEGGCPANVAGNMAGGPDLQNPYTFNFTIPDGISPGKYTLAWTWFNRIGNREMYMNCAPVTVSGGSSKRSPEELAKRAASFPPMFVANINGCTTKENFDIRFPNPGDYVEYSGEAANLAEDGAEACTGTPTFSGAGDTASSGSSSSGASSSGSSSAGPESGSVSGSASSGSGSTGSASVPAVTASVSVAPDAAAAPSNASADSESAKSSAATSAPVSTVASPGSDSASTSSSSSSSDGLAGACSTEGQWNCLGGSSFQRCASGTWTTPQPMSTGTQCNAGQSAELVITASKKARHVSSMRFRKRNIHGSHFS